MCWALPYHALGEGPWDPRSCPDFLHPGPAAPLTAQWSQMSALRGEMKRDHVPPSTMSRAGNGWSQEEWPNGAHPGQVGIDVQGQLSQLENQARSPWPWQMRCLKANWAGSRPFTTPQELLDTGSSQDMVKARNALLWCLEKTIDSQQAFVEEMKK